jgi:hypothetical protein
MTLLASDINRALDPVQLMRDAGLEPDDWQRNLLRTSSRRVLMLCARQTGKTETAVTLAEHTALYQPGSLTLIVSPSQRQSGETFKRLMALHQKLKDVPELVAESALRAQYANGSRVIALPGSERTTRGYTRASLVIIDEAARTEEALLAALRPTMATVDGSLIALSTPFGKRGWFYTAWVEGGDDWTRVRVPASACPRLTESFLAEERRALGPLRYSEEYELAFVDDETAVFPTAIIDRAFVSDLEPLWAA